MLIDHLTFSLVGVLVPLSSPIPWLVFRVLVYATLRRQLKAFLNRQHVKIRSAGIALCQR